jgi:3-oxoisoapionate decarboxylase
MSTDSTSRLGKIGIGSWTYPWGVGTISDHLPARLLKPGDLVSKAYRVGAEAVQVVDNLPLHQCSTADLDEFRSAAIDRNVEIEIGTRGVTPSHLLTYLRIAERVGAKLVRTMAGWHGKPPPLAEVERDLREVLPVFRGADIKIALENYEAYSTRDLGNLINTLGDNYLGACLDLTNSFGALENKEQILNHLAAQAINVHLKDFAVERVEFLMGFAFRGRPVGEGCLPLTDLFSTLAKFGNRPNVIVEHWTPFAGTLEKTLELEDEWASRSVDFLKGLPWWQTNLQPQMDANGRE